MASAEFLPLESFTFVVSPPESRLNYMAINIYEDGKFNLNGRLAEKLFGKPLQIRFTEDGRNLCLVETSSAQAIVFPKNGSKRLLGVIEHLKRHKIAFPVRYEVFYDDQQKMWQGEHRENPFQSPERNTSRLKKN